MRQNDGSAAAIGGICCHDARELRIRTSIIPLWALVNHTTTCSICGLCTGRPAARTIERPGGSAEAGGRPHLSLLSQDGPPDGSTEA